MPPSSIADRLPTLPAEFFRRVDLSPDAIAFQAPDGAGGWRSLSWAQTRDRVVDLAAGLLDLGVAVEDRVAIAATTSLDWILADFAIMCAGAATTTVYPTTGADDVGFILGDSESRVVFVENADQLAKILTVADETLRAAVVFDVTGVAVRPTADAAATGEAETPDPAGTTVADTAAPTAGSGATVRRGGVTILDLDQLAERGRARLAREPDAVERAWQGLDPEKLATLIYTSGTTGRPKGVRLVHDNWTYTAAAVDLTGVLRPDDVQYLWLPLSHVFGKVLVALQTRIGFSTAVNGDLDGIVPGMAAVRPTFMAGAPRIFEKVKARVTLTAQGEGLKSKIFDWAVGVGSRRSRLRQHGRPVPPVLAAQCALADRLVFNKIKHLLGGRVRFLVSGSAALSREVAEWFDAAGVPILEGYGLTETSAASAVNLPDDYRIGTVGPPVPGTEAIIAADGEILLRGPGIMRGYHHQPDLTAEVLDADGWFHTGDIGELVDGYLRVTDRKKDLIKTSGGKYVAPQKLEIIFRAVCPYASQIIVLGEGRKFISAMVTLDPDAMTGWAAEHGRAGADMPTLATDPAVHTLIEGYITELNGKLERWETVKRFVILPADLTVEDGELTPSMKMRRSVVAQRYAADLGRLYAD